MGPPRLGAAGRSLHPLHEPAGPGSTAVPDQPDTVGPAPVPRGAGLEATASRGSARHSARYVGAVRFRPTPSAGRRRRDRPQDDPPRLSGVTVTSRDGAPGCGRLHPIPCATMPSRRQKPPRRNHVHSTCRTPEAGQGRSHHGRGAPCARNHPDVPRDRCTQRHREGDHGHAARRPRPLRRSGRPASPRRPPTASTPRRARRPSRRPTSR